MEALKLKINLEKPEFHFDFTTNSVNKRIQNERETLEDEIIVLLKGLLDPIDKGEDSPAYSLLSASPTTSELTEYNNYIELLSVGNAREARREFFKTERADYLTLSPSPSVSGLDYNAPADSSYPDLIRLYGIIKDVGGADVTELGNKIDEYLGKIYETKIDKDLDFENLGSQGNTKIIERKYDYDTLAPSASVPAITYSPYESPYDPFSEGNPKDQRLVIGGPPEYHYEFSPPISAVFNKGVYIAMEVNLQGVSETDLINNKLSLFSSCSDNDTQIFSCCLDFGSKKKILLTRSGADREIELLYPIELFGITKIEILIHKEELLYYLYLQIDDTLQLNKQPISITESQEYNIKTLGIDYSVDGNGFKKLNSYFPGVIKNFKLCQTFLDSPIDAVTIDALQDINAELERKIRVLQQTATTAESQQNDYSELTAPALSTLLGMSPDSVSDIYQFNELSQEYEKLMNQKDNILKQNSKHEIILRSSQNLQKKIKFYHNQIKILKVVTLITHIILAIIVVVAIMYRMLAK